MPAAAPCRFAISAVFAPRNPKRSRVRFTKRGSDPIAAWLKANSLTETTLYLVTTMGVPLKIAGSGGSRWRAIGSRFRIDAAVCDPAWQEISDRGQCSQSVLSAA